MDWVWVDVTKLRWGQTSGRPLVKDWRPYEKRGCGHRPPEGRRPGEDGGGGGGDTPRSQGHRCAQKPGGARHGVSPGASAKGPVLLDFRLPAPRTVRINSHSPKPLAGGSLLSSPRKHLPFLLSSSNWHHLRRSGACQCLSSRTETSLLPPWRSLGLGTDSASY